MTRADTAEAPPRSRRRVRAASLPPRLAPSAPAIARRRRRIGFAKLVLPALAACLLASVALWPELAGNLPLGEVGLHGQPVTPTGEIVDARYRGIDATGRRFTLTAATASQDGLNIINLTQPKADIGATGGPWLYGSAARGVLDRASHELDLAGGVMLYRSDGTTLTTDTATMDFASGVAVGNARVHVEGPFGTLDAQGFSASDGGEVIRFTGPGRLVLKAVGG